MTSLISASVIEDSFPTEDDFHDLFSDLEQLEPFDIKKEELAAQLAALLSCVEETRSGFANKSGWKKSRVSNVLNGRGNPTFKTLWEFARYLGYEADLHFRRPNELPAKQPWNFRKQEIQSTSRIEKCSLYPFEVQTAKEVAKDMLEGKHKELYLSITTSTYSNSFGQPQQFPDRNNLPHKLTFTIPAPRLDIKETICQKML